MTGRNIGGTTYTLTYDTENRLKSVTQGGQTTTFTYDADGQQVMRETVTDTIVYMGSHYEARFEEGDMPEDLDGDCDVDIVDIMMVASRWSCECGDGCYDSLYDFDSDCCITVADIMQVAARWRETCPEELVETVKYYTLGGRRVAMRKVPADPPGQVGTLYYLFSDHLGSTSVAYDTSNDTWTTQRYYPYGSTRSGGVPTDYTFTGQKLDESTGLMYYGARYYDASLGRWIQPDSIVPNPGNPQDLNRYAYVRNNPLKYTDPSGHGAYDAWDPGAGGAPIGAYKKAFGIYGYPMPGELYEAFEAGYNPFFDPDNFLISEDGTVLVRGAGNDVYFQEYYHWAFDTGGWLPLPQDLRHDVFAYWTVVQAGVSVLKPTDWKDITVQGVGAGAVFAGAMVADLLGRGGGEASVVVVVGESMSRVEKAAEQLRQQGLDVRTYNPREGTLNSMEANRSWLRYWTKVKHATVVDIGTDFNRKIPSDFYAMENRSLYANWQYENVVQWDPGF